MNCHFYFGGWKQAAWWPIPKRRYLKLMDVQKKRKVNGGTILGDMGGKVNNAKV